MEAFLLLFNASLVLFVVLSMASAGFSTTFEQLASVYRRWLLVLLVLIAALVIRPLVGWGVAEVFDLDTGAYIAMILLASVAGAPFAAKLAMGAKANLVDAATLQVTIAVIASFTFAPTANLILEAADLGEGIELPVWDILSTIVVLQVVPFAIGLVMRHWTEELALEWNEYAKKGSGLFFVAVLALALLGSWQIIIDLIGDRVLIAGAVFTAIMLVVGYFFAVGETRTRQATALVVPLSNAGPSLAAVGIAFDNDPAILGPAVAIIVVQLIGGTLASTFFGKQNADADSAGAEAPAEAAA